jgi:hypothetical protein
MMITLSPQSTCGVKVALCEPADHQSLGVDQDPLLLNFGGLGRISLHRFDPELELRLCALGGLLYR